MARRDLLSRRAMLGWPIALGGTAALAAAPPTNTGFSAELFAAMTRALVGALRQRRGAAALIDIEGDSVRFAFNSSLLADTLAKPGSTVKPFLLRHLLETGALAPSSEHLCRGRLRFAGRILDCSHAPQPVPLRPEEALALSCNEFFLDEARRLRPGSVAKLLREYGFDSRQPFRIASAAASVGSPVNAIDAALQGIGESHVLVTPLSLLAAYRRLLRQLFEAPNREANRLVIAGMEGCVRYGTGAEAAVKGISVGGKTGTATSPERQRLDGWFLSYASAGRPRYAMVVFVENGRGGADAAPAAHALWNAMHAGGVLS